MQDTVSDSEKFSFKLVVAMTNYYFYCTSPWLWQSNSIRGDRFKLLLILLEQIKLLLL